MDFFEKQLMAWSLWRQVSDFRESGKVGFKPTGIEHRIMVEGGVYVEDSKGTRDWTHIQRIDAAYVRLHAIYPEYMKAVELYFLYNRTYRPVRMRLNISQVKCRKIIQDGMLMLLGASAIVEI